MAADLKLRALLASAGAIPPQTYFLELYDVLDRRTR
jgi:hypothetical protein